MWWSELKMELRNCWPERTQSCWSGSLLVDSCSLFSSLASSTIASREAGLQSTLTWTLPCMRIQTRTTRVRIGGAKYWADPKRWEPQTVVQGWWASLHRLGEKAAIRILLPVRLCKLSNFDVSCRLNCRPSQYLSYASIFAECQYIWFERAEIYAWLLFD